MLTRSRLLMVVLATSVGSYALLQSMAVPTLSTFQTEYDTDQATTSWVLTAFLISAAVATPILGRLGDTYGKRRMLLVSLVALAIGSLFAALAPSIELLIAARVLQGVGSGAMPLAFGIARDELSPGRVPTAIAFLSSLMAIGFGVGILLGGLIVEWLGFHWLFVLPAITSALAAVAVCLVVPLSPVTSRQRIPAVPVLLLATWLVTLLLGITQAPRIGWDAPVTMILIATGAALMALWIWTELHLDVPLIDLRMMRLRGVWTANAVALLTGIALFAAYGFVPQLAQTSSANGYGLDATASGAALVMVPSAFMSFVAGASGAWVIRRVGVRTAMIVACLAAASGLGLVAVAHDAYWQLCLAVGVSGFGLGLVYSSMANAVVAAVPQYQTATATGVNTNIRTIGGAIGTAAVSTILASHSLPTGVPTESAYSWSFAALAAAALLAAVAATFAPRRTPDRSPRRQRATRISHRPQGARRSVTA